MFDPPPMYDIGCPSQESFMPCVDQNDPDVDTNGDGMLSPPELIAVCNGKCPSPLDFPFNGPPFLQPDGDPLGILGPFDACLAITAEIETAAMACDPASPGHLDPWSNSRVPPTGEGTFSSGTPDNDAEITVNGVTVAVNYDGEFAFSISDCMTIRDHEVCYLDLQALRLDLVGTPTFGDYRVDTAVVDLAIAASTTATFTCDATACFGTFIFASRTGTALSANFSWDQTRISTGAVGGGGLAFREGALASIAEVYGELDLDPTMSTGTLRLWGSGADNFRGDIASATFDLTGPVSVFQL